ncbi:YqeG family HAD IIIA-type phosphatase [Bacillaceae bacterium Marseille-Q3522]|nr:YqeG family HAD IIIA-type phosphatase [Bacillaceae bacterium Marseille-Q3522]
MLKKFLPNQQVKSVLEIRPEQLKEKGIKGIITDLDNTLVEWDRPMATPAIINWFAEMKKNEIQITIVSNNNENRVKIFSEPLQIPFISKARKPLKRAFYEALKEMSLQKTEIVVIGDQLFTDILGGNRGGFYTVLVIPVVQTDGLITRFNRILERRVLKWFHKKGLLKWEE